MIHLQFASQMELNIKQQIKLHREENGKLKQGNKKQKLISLFYGKHQNWLMAGQKVTPTFNHI